MLVVLPKFRLESLNITYVDGDYIPVIFVNGKLYRTNTIRNIYKD